jgi:hypothetical protein
MDKVKCWMVVDKDGDMWSIEIGKDDAEGCIRNLDAHNLNYAPHRIIAGHFVPEEIKKEEG